MLVGQVAMSRGRLGYRPTTLAEWPLKRLAWVPPGRLDEKAVGAESALG